MPGGWEWIVILVVALLIFGKNLPDVARAIGKALTELRRGMDEIKSDVQTAVYESERENRKRIEPPKSDTKSDTPAPEQEEPYEGDDTEMFGDAYDNEGFTDITDEDRAAEIEAEQEQQSAEPPPEGGPQKSEEQPSDSSQPPSPSQAAPAEPDEKKKQAS